MLHSDPGAPLIIGELVTVGHMVTLHGCNIGDGTLIGMGASVLNHARIGQNCLVGAQALITEGKEFPDGMLIVGAPARAIRPLTPQELARIAGNRQRYIERARRYRRRPARPGLTPGGDSYAVPSGRTLINPSWASVATSLTSAVNTWPCARPRPPLAAGLSSANSSHSSTRQAR